MTSSTRKALTDASGSSSLVAGMDACGSMLVFCIGAVARAVDRDLTGAGASGTPIANYTPTNAGTKQQIRTDGTTTVLVYGNYVEGYNATSGVSLWVVDHGAPVWDVCMTAGFCYIVGDIGTTNYHLRKLALADGTQSWGYRHSAAGSLYSVETNGRAVFVAGSVSSYGSGATLRAIRAADGYDDGNEGGLGDETGVITWNVVLGTAPTAGRKLACDGGSLYVASLSGGSSDEIEVFGQGDGLEVASRTLPGTQSAQYIAVDQDYILVSAQDGAGGGGLYCLDKRTLATCWYFRAAADTTDDHAACTTDGFTVFALGQGASNAIYRISRGNRPMRVRRIDPATAIYSPYRRLVLQPAE